MKTEEQKTEDSRFTGIEPSKSRTFADVVLFESGDFQRQETVG